MIKVFHLDGMEVTIEDGEVHFSTRDWTICIIRKVGGVFMLHIREAVVVKKRDVTILSVACSCLSSLWDTTEESAFYIRLVAELGFVLRDKPLFL